MWQTCVGWFTSHLRRKNGFCCHCASESVNFFVLHFKYNILPEAFLFSFWITSTSSSVGIFCEKILKAPQCSAFRLLNEVIFHKLHKYSVWEILISSYLEIIILIKSAKTLVCNLKIHYSFPVLYAILPSVVCGWKKYAVVKFSFSAILSLSSSLPLLSSPV